MTTLNLLDLRTRPEDLDAGTDMDEYGHRKRLGEILVENGLITKAQRSIALDIAESSFGQHLGSVLIDLGYAKEEAVGRALAAQLNIPYVTLEQIKPTLPMLEMLTPKLARRHRCVPVYAGETSLLLAMENPFDVVAIDDVERVTGRSVAPAVTTPSVVSAALLRYYGEAGGGEL